jgi:protein-S-isoprenylcysteine O-methyltransferase Ste14
MNASKLELRVPPPIVAIAVALLMWIAGRFVEPLPIPGNIRLIASLVIAGLGLALGTTAIVTFSRAGTTVNPTKPEATTSLVMHGIYLHSRNPMYVSLLLYLVAWAVYLASWPAALGLPAFILYMNRYQIAPEERVLAARFPEDFSAYRRAVRRWL